jgi:HTH-type transcriptional regulator/antitoxin HigA
MLRPGWLQETDAAPLEIQAASFREVNSVEEIPYLAHAAKKFSLEDIPAPQLAWLFRVKQIAKSLSPMGAYSQHQVR